MMIDISPWYDGTTRPEFDYVAVLFDQERERRRVVWKIQNDLIRAAQVLGQTEAQATTKLNELFTFQEWATYLLTGSDAIKTTIQNDATLPWLDTVYPAGSGVTLRTRLINRL